MGKRDALGCRKEVATSRGLRRHACGGARRHATAWSRAFALAAALTGALVSTFAAAQEPAAGEARLDALHHSGARYEVPVRQEFPGARGLGGSVAEAGDVNGDGAPDLLISADGADSELPGRVWVLFGGRSPGSTTLSLFELDAFDGVEIRSGLAGPDRFGSFVAGAGDADGDGTGDFLIGVPSTLHPALEEGGAVLVLGGGRLPRRTDPAALDGRGVLLATRFQQALLGTAGAWIGDVNGDGVDDLALGVPQAVVSGTGGELRRGRVFVVFGSVELRALASSARPVLVLDELEPPFGLRIDGVQPGSELGSALAALGDLDGDGFDDFAVASPRGGDGGVRGGAVHVVFGGPHLTEAPIDLATPEPGRLLEIGVSATGSLLGAALAGGRDLTGDGMPDVALGAPRAPRGGVLGVGFVAILPGGPGLRDAGRLDALDAATAVLWGARGSEAGSALALVPDRNGDDAAELLAGAPGANDGLGKAYLALGGEHLENGLLLDEIASAGGLILSHGSLSGRTRLGRAVAGLDDRNGDGAGDFAVGAPGFRPGPRGEPAEGAVYEVFAAGAPAGPGHLRCEALTRGRVRLSWTLATPFRRLRVLRADAGSELRPASALLPGDLQLYVDIPPGPGEYLYVIEADEDPRLRSNPCRASVRPLSVLGMTCAREAGSTRVSVEWTLGEEAHLTLKVDGEVVEGLEDIAPPRHAVVLDLAPQASGEPPYLIELASVADPGMPLASCRVGVPELALPPVGGLSCALVDEDPPAIRIAWTHADVYEVYEVYRNGVLIALAGKSASHLDDHVPSRDAVHYAVRGLRQRFDPGPFSSCRVELVPENVPSISGRVVYDDRDGTPLGRGVVFVHASDDGAPIGRGGVGPGGEFRVATGDHPGPFDLEYRAQFVDVVGADVLPFLREDLERPEPAPGLLRARLEGIPRGEEEPVEIRVALPVLAVSPTRSDTARWRSLHERLRAAGAAILFVSSVEGGVARATLDLGEDIGNARRILERQFGRAPAELDLVAYGFAGLAARLYIQTAPEEVVRRLVLLGTPNLGTPRALIELRSDLGSRPGPGELEAGGTLGYRAADEQTGGFLERYNARIQRARGVRLHLVAGSGGKPELNGVLGCSAHDGRVCVSSALAEGAGDGLLAGGERHVVGEDHATLGRGAASLRLLLDGLGLARVLRGAGEGGAGGEPLGALQAHEDGGGAGLDGGLLALGKVLHGELVPGGTGSYVFASDTSGSIIIILNIRDPGGLDFTVKTPGGAEVDSTNAGAHGAVYLSYNDGEGNNVQTYRFLAGERGKYGVTIANAPESPVVEYTLESRLESPIRLAGALDESELELGGTTRIQAVLENDHLLPAGTAVVTAGRLLEPDGTLQLLAMNDAGTDGDELAGDGIYSVLLPASSQPGYHTVEIEASGGEDFERAATLQLLVRSDLATLGADFASGADAIDGAGDGGGAGSGLKDTLWVEGSIDAARGGSVIVIGALTDAAGIPVSQSGTIFSLEEALSAQFRLDFGGYEIFGSERDGPYVLSQVEILDAGVGFVRADLRRDAHITEAYSWRDFSLDGGLPFVRGDANNDRAVDLSDAIAVLLHLFEGAGVEITCDDAADTNADGRIDLSDGIEVINYLFLGATPLLAPPFPDCGQGEALGCEYYPYCR